MNRISFVFLIGITILLSGCVELIGNHYGQIAADSMYSDLNEIQFSGLLDNLFVDQEKGRLDSARNKEIFFKIRMEYSKRKKLLYDFKEIMVSGIGIEKLADPWSQPYFYRELGPDEFVMGTMGPNRKWNVRITDRFLKKLHYGNLNIFKDDIFVRIMRVPATAPVVSDSSVTRP